MPTVCCWRTCAGVWQEFRNTQAEKASSSTLLAWYKTQSFETCRHLSNQVSVSQTPSR